MEAVTHFIGGSTIVPICSIQALILSFIILDRVIPAVIPPCRTLLVTSIPKTDDDDDRKRGYIRKLPRGPDTMR